MFGSIGFTELVLILMIVLIIFGAGKLPQLGEGLGKAIKGFKKSVQEAEAVEPELQQSQATGTSPESVAQAQIAASSQPTAVSAPSQLHETPTQTPSAEVSTSKA